MRKRWLRVGGLAAVLFVINVVTRLVSRLGYGDGTPEDLTAQERVGWVSLAAVALVMALTAGWWIRRRSQSQVGGELVGGAGAAGLLSVLVGPFVSEPPRFTGGVGGVIIELSVYWGIAALGALVGELMVIAAGRDYRSRQLREYAQSRAVKRRRPVRR